MTQPRFLPQGVETKGGRSVVSVSDRVTGETLKVYRRGTCFLYFKNDLQVTNKALQRVVREALEGAGVS